QCPDMRKASFGQAFQTDELIHHQQRCSARSQQPPYASQKAFRQLSTGGEAVVEWWIAKYHVELFLQLAAAVVQSNVDSHIAALEVGPGGHDGGGVVVGRRAAGEADIRRGQQQIAVAA